MDLKLEKLLTRIKFKESDLIYFNNGKLLKILIDKKLNSYFFQIELENILPSDLYIILLNLLKNKFNNIDNIDIEIKSINVDFKLIESYIPLIMDYITQNSKTLNVLKTREIIINDNSITMETYNKLETKKLESLKKEIEVKMNYFGFNGFKLIIKENDLKREEIKEKIKEEKESNIVIEEQNEKIKTIIYGDEITSKKITKLKDIISEENDITIECFIFDINFFESSKNNIKIITLKVTDYTDSMHVKIFLKDNNEYKTLSKELKQSSWVKIKGFVKNDQYSKDLVISARDINNIASKDEIRLDLEEEKRVELHTHTFMSQMDGLVDVKKLIKQAKKWGHKAIAITDHNSCQAYPDAYHEANDIKVIYGVEISMIDDTINVVKNEKDYPFLTTTFVVFDLETTGLNANLNDQIIEIGAVKICNGEIIDTYSTLIDPMCPLSSTITKITGITDKMLKGEKQESDVIVEFKKWIDDLPVVAHNAKFDISFIESAYQKYNLGKFNNTIIDTLELSRVLDPNEKKHSLSAIVKRYDVLFDEEDHHRALYDASKTADILHKMLKRLENRNIENVLELNNMIKKEDLHKIGRPYHITLLAKNNDGLKNIFKIVSQANTKYLHKTPRILRSVINELRDGILIGSSCYNGEVFEEASSKSDEELSNIISFYDYIEIQPISVYNHLLQTKKFENKELLERHIKKIINNAKSSGKIVVATGDVHHLDLKDKIYRQIIVNQKVPGGGRHPFDRSDITEIPSQHFMTTKEMLDEFYFLDNLLAYEIVITNTNKIADMIEVVKVIKNNPTPFSPKIKDSEKLVKEITYNKAYELYGKHLPELIKDRIEKELYGIIGGGFDVIYLIAHKLVKKSNEDGYIVGSRGSVGSSIIATLMGITEVNPLPPHYRCKKCLNTIFEINNKNLSDDYDSGYDLPDLICSKCNIKMIKDGNDMPFATFLGFNADKIPDIDLNFSGEYQSKAHDYTKELFGEKYVFRAGTIGTVADKTAFGFVQGYLNDKALTLRSSEIERISMGCVGVKRTTGQHPGGIVVIPNYMDIFDFTPYQYPADDSSNKWYTTHFDYHAIDNDLLKLDILGHDVPTLYRILSDLTNVDIDTIPFDDQKTMSLLVSPHALGVNALDIECETGTLGIPELGTKFVIQMLLETKPKTFAELIKISGLSHGTDVWHGNSQDLIKQGICEFKDVIGCRDDIMLYLIKSGIDPLISFKIMEAVRKGKGLTLEWEEEMKLHNIPNWYIECCNKIKYMFPKSHAVAYVMAGYRIAWFKLYYPIEYYAAFFSIKATDFDIDTMLEGYNKIKTKIHEINDKGNTVTNKEMTIKEVLELALEMTARGYTFSNIDLYKSDAVNFIIDYDNKALIPPFRTISGLGDVVANNIVLERNKNRFISIDDLKSRTKISTTIIDKMNSMGILKELPETSQLTFDLKWE